MITWSQGKVNTSTGIVDTNNHYAIITEKNDIPLGAYRLCLPHVAIDFKKVTNGQTTDVSYSSVTRYIFFYDANGLYLGYQNVRSETYDFIDVKMSTARKYIFQCYCSSSSYQTYPEEPEPMTGTYYYMNYCSFYFDVKEFNKVNDIWLSSDSNQTILNTIEQPIPLSYWRIDRAHNNGYPWHERLLDMLVIFYIWELTSDRLTIIPTVEQQTYWSQLLEWLKNPTNDGRDTRVFDEFFKTNGLIQDPVLLLSTIMKEIDLDELADSPMGSDFIKDLMKAYTQVQTLRKNQSDLSIWNPSLHKLWQKLYRKYIPFVTEYSIDPRKVYEGTTIDEQIIDNQPTFTTTDEEELFANINTYGIAYRITNILNADAGANFWENPYDNITVKFPWVVPWYNLNSESYSSVRADDKIPNVLSNEFGLNFTEYKKRRIELNNSYEQGYINDDDEELNDRPFNLRTKDYFSVWNYPKIKVHISSNKNILHYAIRFYLFRRQGEDSFVRETGWLNLETENEIELSNYEGIHYARIVLESDEEITPQDITDSYIEFITDTDPNSANSTDPFVRLLMPQNQRHVEIEDLNRNFWVIGQVTTAIQNEMFNDGINQLIKDVIKELADLWDNILFLWTAAAIIPQKPKYTKWKTIVVPIYENEFRPYYKYDDFDINNPSENYLKDIVSPILNEYQNVNLLIIPEIRSNNYEHNYYSKVSFPCVLKYDRNEEDWITTQWLNDTSDNSIKIEHSLNDNSLENYFIIQQDENKLYFGFVGLDSVIDNYCADGRSYILVRYKISYTQEGSDITSFQMNIYDLGYQILPLEENHEGFVYYYVYSYDPINQTSTIISQDGDDMQYSATHPLNDGNATLKKGFYQGEILSYYHDKGGV